MHAFVRKVTPAKFQRALCRLFFKNGSFPGDELQNSKIGAEEELTETFRCLWPFFNLSRFIGMCPVTRRKGHLFVAKCTHPAWIITGVVLITQLISLGHTVIQIKDADTTEERAKLLNDIIYYIHTLFNGFYMAWNVKSVPTFLIACAKIEKILKKHSGIFIKNSKGNISRDCFLLLVFLTVGQLASNLLYFISVAHREEATTVPEFFRAFNTEFTGEWGSMYSGIYYCFGDWNCDMGWNFTDILLAIVSALLGRFFRRLNQVMRNPQMSLSARQVEDLRCDHRDICNLVEICNSIFSPLILLTYMGNMSFLFTRLYTGISEGLEAPLVSVRAESLYALWYQILLKILLPCYLAAKLHEEANEGLKLIHNWSSALGTPDCKLRLLVINRFVTQIVTTPVGISGCGYFLISKSFIMALLSALVTYEVIILQFQGARIT